MIRAGQDFWAKLSTGEWSVIVTTDTKGVTLPCQSIVITQKEYLSRDYLDTCVHEACHASRDDMSEAEVEKLAGDITEVLWKRGYRLPKQRKSVDKD